MNSLDVLWLERCSGSMVCVSLWNGRRLIGRSDAPDSNKGLQTSVDRAERRGRRAANAEVSNSLGPLFRLNWLAGAGQTGWLERAKLASGIKLLTEQSARLFESRFRRSMPDQGLARLCLTWAGLASLLQAFQMNGWNELGSRPVDALLRRLQRAIARFGMDLDPGARPAD